MDKVKEPVNQSYAEIVKAVLNINDCDLINGVVDVLITPQKRNRKNRPFNFYQAKKSV